MTTAEVYKIHLFSREGVELSSVDVGSRRVYSFNAFDKEGNFYFEGRYNWVYFGYDHYGHGVFSGKTENNTLSMVEIGNSVIISGILNYALGCIEYICQDYYYAHEIGAELLGDRYLVTKSITFGRLQIIDMQTNTLCMSMSEDFNEPYSYNYDLGSVGVRAAYLEDQGSIVIYDSSERLVMYDLASGKEKASYTTAYPLFMVTQVGNTLYLLERGNESFVLETISWERPSSITLDAKDTMKIGESQKILLELDTPYEMDADWESSDNSVATVTGRGIVNAFRAGEAVITASLMSGELQKSMKIRVEEGTAAILGANTTLTEADSENLSNYSYRADSVKNSYLYEKKDGSLVRVEYLDGKGVLVQTLDEDGNKNEPVVIEAELKFFGGFFAGERYNFLVFGQSNPDESDEEEVVRIVRYGEDWTRQESLSVFGANTRSPFSCGFPADDGDRRKTLYTHLSFDV